MWLGHFPVVVFLLGMDAGPAAAGPDGEPALTWAAADAGLLWRAPAREAAAPAWAAVDPGLLWRARP